MISDFGEKIEPFNEILNEAEQKLNILIISSNLTGEQFLERYGDRTMDRLKRLCKIISFKGNSLRS
jgi:DNA replication protein DnaC